MLSSKKYKLLFDSCFDPLRNYIFYRIGDEEAASDIAQDVFLKIWEKRKQWKEDSSLKGLLYKMASDMIVSQYRKNDLYQKFSQYIAINTPKKEVLTPEDDLCFTELKEKYARALAKMKEAERTTFLMNREEGYKYKEIAERLSLSEKTIEKRISTALQILKRTLLMLVWISQFSHFSWIIIGC